MIVDLVRNDLGRVCECGLGRRCPALFEVEDHPGLHHLVSTVRGRLRPGVGWADAHRRHVPARARSPARPKLAALDAIAALEPVARGRLLRRRRLGRRRPPARATSTSPSARSGSTTARCTSAPAAPSRGTPTPEGEWDETELKARRLIRVASGRASSRDGPGVKAWLDGRLVDPADAGARRSTTTASPSATACFETLKVRRRRAVRPHPPPRRLRRSATGLGLAAPDDDRVRDAVRRRRRPPTAPASGGCASPSPAAGRRSARAGATRARPRRCSSARRRDWPPTTAVAVVPVGPQRALRRRRAQDDDLRRERRRPRAGRRAAGLQRGAVRQHPRRAVRGHRHERLRRARRPAA